MSKDIFTRMREYFDGCAKEMSAKSRKSSIHSHKGDAGDSREQALLKFIADHLPIRCRVAQGGFIFDVHGNESKQMDLLVTNDLAIQFNNNGKGFTSIEGCYCAISIKTEINKDELFDALHNIASIPLLTPETMELDPDLCRVDQAIYLSFPLKIVFAYRGLKQETISQHLQDFYSANKEIQIQQRPDLIISLDDFCFVRQDSYSVVTGTGSEAQTEASSRYQSVDFEDIGAYSLFRLMTQIQTCSNLGASVKYTFNPYFKRTWKPAPRRVL